MARIAPSKRITIAVSESLVRALDKHVACGAAATRTDLISEAIQREVRRLEDEAIDAQIYALADDPELAAIESEIMEEFEASDAEAWAMLDEEYGPEPPDGGE